jgi:Protein of unknown function (DUF3828)
MIEWSLAMPTRRDVLIGAACIGVALRTTTADAADTSAHDFVAAIYDTYVGKNGNGVTLDTDQAVKRYFEPTLAALIRKDQTDAARRDETPTLDFDPFVDAQDWDIAAFTITMTDAGPGKAKATVKFENSGKPSQVVLDLVKIGNAWKISDIAWQPHDPPNTLRGLYAH